MTHVVNFFGAKSLKILKKSQNCPSSHPPLFIVAINCSQFNLPSISFDVHRDNLHENLEDANFSQLQATFFSLCSFLFHTSKNEKKNLKFKFFPSLCFFVNFFCVLKFFCCVLHYQMKEEN